jgi:hypothetical protein
MAQERIKLLKHRPPIAVAQMAARPEEGRGDSIRGARGCLNVTQEIKGGVQQSRDHDQTAGLGWRRP